MKKVLVLGGTRFFGKKLVQHLIDSQADVTIATRGITADPFGDRVTRLSVDREDAESLHAAARQGEWDIVYDNICYSPQNALDACQAFSGRTARYIFTSTLSVYDFGPARLTEADFDPYRYPIVMGSRSDFTYQEGKRQAEAVFFQKAEFPVAAVRFPIVLGDDDYTLRLHDQVKRVRNGAIIGVPNPDALMSFISSDDAAQFLFWLQNSPVTGPINACSTGNITVGGVMQLIEQAVGKNAIIHKETTEDNHSPFGVPKSWHMDTQKAQDAGFAFERLEEWLPQ
ncbi:MAG: NAD-dependent epimerase/dehydratase family protein, partial [Clostridia bacterium]